MRSRTNGRWWRSAIEAPDPRALANSSSRLLDRPVGDEVAGPGDLDSAVDEAVGPGASLARHDLRETTRVLRDPAGCPLCLCLETD